jgi:tetratricopeptide (TPR) repeat protein
MKVFRTFPVFLLFGLALIADSCGSAGPSLTLVYSASDGEQSAPKDKPSIGNVLHKIILDQGVAAAVKEYRRLKTETPDAYDFAEDRLNDLGLDLIEEGRVKDAIEIFKLNVEAYPNAFNPWDSLGYGYMCDGRRELAILNFRKSVELNPANTAGSHYAYLLEHYDKKEVLIPMRDGVKLFTQIYSPRDTSRTYPILFRRTP